MAIAAVLEEIPKPVWILLMILGFMAWWPIGLVLLALMIGGRRMTCWNHNGCGHWEPSAGHWQAKMERMQERMDRVRGRMEQARRNGGGWGAQRSSGNRAFDDYRTETLRRLEDEQREFKEFLERLRFAKDRAEFDQFMNERRNRARDERPRDEGSQPQA
ncbi:MAG TPA: DUF2852 domain-containing protein [Xanthobacteraceae bacterium]|jgi:hypothetical protein